MWTDNEMLFGQNSVPLRVFIEQDFSFTNREYRVFYVKLPNGQMTSEVVRSLVVMGREVCSCVGIEGYMYIVLYFYDAGQY